MLGLLSDSYESVKDSFKMSLMGHGSSLVISNERLVRVMPDVNRLALSIHLHRSPVEIVKSEQIVFGNLDHRPKKKAFNY